MTFNEFKKHPSINKHIEPNGKAVLWVGDIGKAICRLVSIVHSNCAEYRCALYPAIIRLADNDHKRLLDPFKSLYTIHGALRVAKRKLKASFDEIAQSK